MAPMRWKRRRSPDMRRQALQQPVEETTGAWEDAYPSRVEPKPQWLPRLDPVVYGSIEQPEGPLTRRQLEDYRRDGFLFFPGLFGATEVAALGAEMARLGSDPVALDRDGSITEPGSGDLRTLFEIHKTSAVFEGLARDPRLAGVARQLLGDEVYISQSRLNYKPGFRAKEFYWHSDFETWHVEDGMPRMRALSISVTLTDNLETNGPLMVMPGSHRTFVACVGATPEDHYKSSLKRQDYGVPDDESLTSLAAQGGIVSTAGHVGSVIVVACTLLTGTNGNTTTLPPPTAIFPFHSMHN